MNGSQWILVGSGWDTSRMVSGCVGGSKWHQQIILDISHTDPTKIYGDPAIWSHLWPEMTVLWHFGAISAPPRAPGGSK